LEVLKEMSVGLFLSSHGTIIQKLVDHDHCIFQIGTRSLVGEIVGIPVLVYRLQNIEDLQKNHLQNHDNILVTRILIDPISGFASQQWQHDIGECLIVREDRKELKEEDLYKLYNICCRHLRSWADGHDFVDIYDAILVVEEEEEESIDGDHIVLDFSCKKFSYND